MFGATPILDFDGTITRLPVDWDSLRRNLGIVRIADLWKANPSAWSVVAAAEVDAASIAEPIDEVVEALRSTERFAVLTNNASSAVRAFLARFPIVGDRVAVIVGREELEGPKTDFIFFCRGLTRCTLALKGNDETQDVTYVGNEPYELDFARRLGMRALDVHELH